MNFTPNELLFFINSLAEEKGLKVHKNAFESGWVVTFPTGEKHIRPDMHAVLTLVLAY